MSHVVMCRICRSQVLGDVRESGATCFIIRLNSNASVKLGLLFALMV